MAGPHGSRLQRDELPLRTALLALIWACSGAEPEPLEPLGPIHISGSGTNQQNHTTHQPGTPEEIAIYRQGCADGDLAACHAAGLGHYYQPASPESDAGALQFFQLGCDGGYPASCNGLGVLYATGRGVPVDKARAVELYRGACEAGISTACTHLELAAP